MMNVMHVSHVTYQGVMHNIDVNEDNRVWSPDYWPLIPSFILCFSLYWQSKMLSIGDGANDVAMIQAADVGIGIAGKEGRQAVNNSDYAIGQFRFLVRLLLVHGQLSHYRLGRLIKFSFFKNICFAFILIYFQFFCGFSGELVIITFTAGLFTHENFTLEAMVVSFL